MSVLALVTGSIFRRPAQRTSKAGKPFVTTTVKVAAGNELQFWNVIAFSETAQAELLRLDEGDGAALQGPLKVEQYERDGKTRISFSVTADRVLALSQPPKAREPHQRETKEAEPRSTQRSESSRPAIFDDDIPF